MANYEDGLAKQLIGRQDLEQVLPAVNALAYWYKRIARDIDWAPISPLSKSLLNIAATFGRTRDLFTQLDSFATSRNAQEQSNLLSGIRENAQSALKDTFAAFGAALMFREQSIDFRHEEVNSLLQEMRIHVADSKCGNYFSANP